MKALRPRNQPRRIFLKNQMDFFRPRDDSNGRVTCPPPADVYCTFVLKTKSLLFYRDFIRILFKISGSCGLASERAACRSVRTAHRCECVVGRTLIFCEFNVYVFSEYGDDLTHSRGDAA